MRHQQTVESATAAQSTTVEFMHHAAKVKFGFDVSKPL
jgi:hypothetical protein